MILLWLAIAVLVGISIGIAYGDKLLAILSSFLSRAANFLEKIGSNEEKK